MVLCQYEFQCVLWLWFTFLKVLTINISSLHDAAKAGQLAVHLLHGPLLEPLALHPRLLGVQSLLGQLLGHDGLFVKLAVLLQPRGGGRGPRRGHRVQPGHGLSHGAADVDGDRDLNSELKHLLQNMYAEKESQKRKSVLHSIRDSIPILPSE